MDSCSFDSAQDKFRRNDKRNVELNKNGFLPPAFAGVSTLRRNDRRIVGASPTLRIRLPRPALQASQ